MQRIIRFLFLMFFVSVLVSCDIFLFPKDGRWNPLDPDNDLERVDVVVPVTVDGYVDENDMRYFDDPLLISDSYNQPKKAILIRFDFSKLPVQVESATLELYAVSALTGTNLVIYVIGQSWTPATIRWLPIYDRSIVVPDSMVSPIDFQVTISNDYNSVDVSDLVKYMQANKDTYGLLITESDRIEFDSSRGASGPRLKVTGWDIPD